MLILVIPFFGNFDQMFHFFVQFLHHFCALFDAITFGVTIFCGSISARISTKIHQSSILFEFRRKIIDFCVLFDASTFDVSILCDCISVRIPTKNYQFLRAFLCYYLRRVDFFVLQLLLEFRRKIVDFGVHFHAITFGVSIFPWLVRANCCSGPRVNAGFVRAATAASLTYY